AADLRSRHSFPTRRSSDLYVPYFNPLQPQMDRLASMQAQYQQPQQQNVNQGILWVQGEAGAKSNLVAPNTSVLLMDSENSQFYSSVEHTSALQSRFDLVCP